MVVQRAISRATLAEQVYEEIKRAILMQEIQPGTRLNEIEIAEAYHVSPTPVREALNKLRSSGLVEYRGFHGHFVTCFTPADIDKIFDVRRVLECLAVSEAGPRLTPDEISKLRQQAVLMAGSVPDAHEANRRFHQVFVIKSENRWLQRMMAELNDLLLLVRSPLTKLSSGQQSSSEHLAIVDALEAGDFVRAELAMAEHVRRVQRDVKALMDSGLAPNGSMATDIQGSLPCRPPVDTSEI